MNTPAIAAYDAEQTARLLDFHRLVDELAKAVRDYAAGRITAPERQVVAYPNGGVMLSMPATAADIGVHKLVNVMAGNRERKLPTINGVVTVYDGDTGQERIALHGPTVTTRRTAAVSMLGLRTLRPGTPGRVAVIGTGTQAEGHMQALAALYPGLRVVAIGSTLEKAQAFIAAHRGLALALQADSEVPEDADVVITVTTSATPVYTLPARGDRLVIGVGAYRPDLAEISPLTLQGSRLYVDDLAGARHEAGDYLQAGIDWASVTALAQALDQVADTRIPAVFKTVGCAAWDLAAARCAARGIN